MSNKDCAGWSGLVLTQKKDNDSFYPHSGGSITRRVFVRPRGVCTINFTFIRLYFPPFFPPSPTHSIFLQLSTDIDVVLSALQNNKHNARFVRYSVAGVSKPVALAVVTAAPQLLGSIPAPMCDDRDVVRAAVTADALALRYASDAVRGDTAFVASLTSTSCMPLRYAGPAVTDNVAFMTAALTRDSTAIFYAGTTVRSDPSFCLAAVRLRGSNLSLCSQHIREDLDIVRAAVTADPNAIRHAADSVRSREEFATLALLTSRDNA